MLFSSKHPRTDLNSVRPRHRSPSQAMDLFNGVMHRAVVLDRHPPPEATWTVMEAAKHEVALTIDL